MPKGVLSNQHPKAISPTATHKRTLKPDISLSHRRPKAYSQTAAQKCLLKSTALQQLNAVLPALFRELLRYLIVRYHTVDLIEHACSERALFPYLRGVEQDYVSFASPDDLLLYDIVFPGSACKSNI